MEITRQNLEKKITDLKAAGFEPVLIDLGWPDAAEVLAFGKPYENGQHVRLYELKICGVPVNARLDTRESTINVRLH